jgi:hypothetical protein
MPGKPEEIGAFEIGRRYRVDWKHKGLRRTFRFVGTLLSVEDATEDGAGRVLVFEVRPRFGRPVLQRVDVAALTAFVPVADAD